MRDFVIKAIKSLGYDDYGIIDILKKDMDKMPTGKSAVLLVQSYGYYNETNKDNLKISPYYFASNRSYKQTKQLMDMLKQNNIEAIVPKNIIAKDYLEIAGAKEGNNQLMFIDGIGSLFCVQILFLDIQLDHKCFVGMTCKNCNNCKTACPTGALVGDEFYKNNCIRERMDNINDQGIREYITQLGGCDMCQRVCKNNYGIKTINAKFDVFNAEKIIKGDITGVAELIGKNMARKQRLQFQGICSAINSKKNVEITPEIVANNNLTAVVDWANQKI